MFRKTIAICCNTIWVKNLEEEFESYWTDAKFAKEVGVHQQSVKAWRIGRRFPRESQLEKMIAVFERSGTENKDLLSQLRSTWSRLQDEKTSEDVELFASVLSDLLDRGTGIAAPKAELTSIYENSDMDAAGKKSGTYIPGWSTLRTLGSSKILRTSFIWLFLTPVAARLLLALPSPLQITIGSTTYPIELSLPFSWQAFFWAAAFISMANTLYSLFCPWIIKDFSDYAHYETNKGYARIREHQMGARALRAYRVDHGSLFRAIDTRLRENRPTNYDAEAMEYYDRCEAYSLQLTFIRFWVTAFYAIGMMLIIFVLAQNVNYVFQELISR